MADVLGCHMALGRAEVLGCPGTVIDQDMGLEPADHGVQAFGLPAAIRQFRPSVVVPQDVDGP